VYPYDHLVYGIIACVALGILAGDLLRRVRQRRELEARWRRENEAFLRQLREFR
jgi:hypothetical protein